MLSWFSALLEQMVEHDCYLQKFHAGYKSDINTGDLMDGETKELPMLCLVGFFNSEEDAENSTERYFVTFEFLALQGYKNDNTVDANHKLVDYFDEVQAMGRAFLASLKTVFKKISQNASSGIQVSIVPATKRKWRRSAFANNDRMISVQVDLQIDFKTGAFNCLPSCDCEKVCVPAYVKADPKKLLTDAQSKC